MSVDLDELRLAVKTVEDALATVNHLIEKWAKQATPSEVQRPRLGRRPRVSEVIARVAMDWSREVYVVTPTMLIDKSRHQALNAPRRHAAWLASKLGYSLPQIGRGMGCHHTTILARVRGATRDIEADPEIAKWLQGILAEWKDPTKGGTG